MFAEIILPFSLQQTFTYSIQGWEGECGVGKRVIVQFGKRRFYAGLIESIHNSPPSYAIKPIVEVLDDLPIISESNLKFWSWVADYYMCSLGEVMNAALPSSLKLESESTIERGTESEIPWDDLTDHEFVVMEALGIHPRLRVAEVGNITGVKSPMKIVNQLLDRSLVQMQEDLKKVVQPKTERWISLDEALDSRVLIEVLNGLKRAPKQRDILEAYLQLKEDKDSNWVLEKDLLTKGDFSKSNLRPLYEKQIFQFEDQTVDPWREVDLSENLSIDFSESQSKAISEISEGFEQEKVTVLNGVTGSGKTEIYFHFIQEALNRGDSAVYMLPEIALTTQLVIRLKKHFKDRVVLYHSKISEGERLAAWNAISQSKDNPCVVIGARSAIFLPFVKLGLVVVDEEHDSSYKQNDPAPRYNGRDSAIMLARLFKSKILLGSATPSLESVYNAKEGKYQWVNLTQRFGGVELPEMEIVDIQKEYRMKTMVSHFSPKLLEEIRLAKNHGNRVILFQNRRGFAPTLECQTCGHVPECKNCDISLTYHKYTEALHCHYCGYSIPMPKRCKKCGGYDIVLKGFGTEKIEEELKEIEPSLRVKRLDLDTTRRKGDFQNIFDDFSAGEIDVLIGTQMVTKGLDFDKVSLVGVLNADSLLYFPDFRAFERSYQMLSQVAGRAGRRSERGKVLIQTFNPFHSVIQQVIHQDFETLVKEQLYERKNYRYPPYFKLIEITIKHKDSKMVNEASEAFADSLKKFLGDRVLGPEFAMVPRLKGMYHKKILIKFEKSLNYHQVKSQIKQTADFYFNRPPFASARIVFDVDPS